MNKEELKNLVMTYFNLAEKQEETSVDTPVKENFVEATLADGTKITNMLDADFEVGQELHVITEENAHVLAPSGSHTTESGIEITVDGEGIITGVKHPDAEGEGSLAEGVTEEMSVEDVAEEVIDVAIEEGMTPEAVVEVVKEVIDAVIAPAMEEMKTKMAEMEEKMKDYMSATPASQSTTESKFSKESKDSLDFLNKKFNRNQARYEAILNNKN